jgi:glycerol kinase
MNKNYILAIDQGTTSTRAILFGKDGNPVSQHQLPHRQLYPRPGWVSHDADEIYAAAVKTGRVAIQQANIPPEKIAAVGITNQRETVVLWNKKTGEPVCDAIVWQCRRTAELCGRMEADGLSRQVRETTGLLIDPYFSATKIKWMLDNIPHARSMMEKGELLAGTMDSFLIWKLTAGKYHVTDYTNASRTLLFNIHTLSWDRDLLDYFGIHFSLLPEVVPCVGQAGVTDASVWGAALPITGIAGDQHASLFGQTCFDSGDAKNTYGTGCFILKNIGGEPRMAEHLLTTLAWYKDGKPAYALEGSVFNAGAAVEWMINDMKLVGSTDEINAICQHTPDTNGAYFVPAFSGLGAPYWDMYARGTVCGLSLSTNRKHIVRAVMESIAFLSRDVIDYMAEASGLSLPMLRVDGGVCNSDFLMQFQADLLNVAVERPKVTETTAQGVFYMAGLGAGMFGDVSELRRLREIGRVFEPQKDVSGQYELWRKAVERSMGWATTR